MTEFVHNGPGRALYEAHRAAYQRQARLRGLTSIPSWKHLKPWQAKMWNDTAANLGSAFDNPYKYGQNLKETTT